MSPLHHPPGDAVSFPGHFLVRLRLRAGTLVLDPFSGGTPVSEAELRERLQRVIPAGVADNVPVAELPLDQFLEPASHRQILSRLLRNLKAIYREADTAFTGRPTPGPSATARARGSPSTGSRST